MDPLAHDRLGKGSGEGGGAAAVKKQNWGAVHRVRLGQINRLLRERYSGSRLIIPDDDAGDGDLFALLCVKAQCYRPDRREKALRDTIALWAPWMSADKAASLVHRAMTERKITSDTLGKWLWLDADTRERMRLWQLGAHDLDATGRAARSRERSRERKRQRDREREEQKRRQNGNQTRGAWLEQNSASRLKPWEALGISRRTYYRRRSKTDGTGPSPLPAVAVTASAVLGPALGQR
jgi:hypothetical protein